MKPLGNDRRTAALVGFCLSTVLLIPLEFYIPGGIIWVLGAVLALTDPDAAFRRRMAVLYGLIGLLAFAPINTDTSTGHFLVLGSIFLACLVVPVIVLRRRDPGVIDYTVLPGRFDWVDVFYVAISVPLAWAIIRFYFFDINPGMPLQWPLPPIPDNEATWRLIIGINCVGVWDELFFINTVYAILRSIFPTRVANLAQAVIYASVLNDMAFIGIGPIVVYLFALTQGAMYERSNALLYVLLVHIIVDVILVGAILTHYYPGSPQLGF